MKIKLLLLSAIFLLLFAVACTETEPSSTALPDAPTLPPANVVAVDPTDAGATLVPTPTLLPTAVTPTEEPPTAVPPIGPVVTTGLPTANADLLFIADGSLKRWRQSPLQIETLIVGNTAAAPTEDPVSRLYNPLVGDVSTLSVSDDGQHAAITQVINKTDVVIDADNSYTQPVFSYEISYINLASNEQRVIMPVLQGMRSPEISLSRDGSYLVVSGLGVGEMPDFNSQQEQMGQLYLVSTAVNSTPQIIDQCQGLCTGMVWHNDNNFFVYDGQDGLTMYNLSASTPELLLSNKNDDLPFDKHYGPISWAANGRYLLLWYSAYIEGSERAVFDIPTRQLMVVPDSGAYIGPFAHMTWMTDDRLFFVELSYETEEAIGKTLRVDVDNSQIVLDEQTVLGQSLYPVGPKHWDNGHFGYALVSVNSDMFGIGNGDSALYQRISFNEDAEQLNSLPNAVSSNPQIIWRTDGSGAIFSDSGSMWYVPTNGETMVDLQTAVGLTAHSFYWLD